MRRSGARLLLLYCAVSAVSQGSALAARAEQPWLELTNTHTGEVVRVASRGEMRVDAAALGSLQHVLRDYRRDASHAMDPALYDLLHDLARSVGREPRYEIISGYRSPETNSALRARSADSGVSEHSLHMQGKAIDVRLKDFSTAQLRDAALKLGRGGVGYYDRSNFVHLDTGRVRHWEGH